MLKTRIAAFALGVTTAIKGGNTQSTPAACAGPCTLEFALSSPCVDSSVDIEACYCQSAGYIPDVVGCIIDTCEGDQQVVQNAINLVEEPCLRYSAVSGSASGVAPSFLSSSTVEATPSASMTSRAMLTSAPGTSQNTVTETSPSSTSLPVPVTTSSAVTTTAQRISLVFPTSSALSTASETLIPPSSATSLSSEQAINSISLTQGAQVFLTIFACFVAAGVVGLACYLRGRPRDLPLFLRPKRNNTIESFFPRPLSRESMRTLLPREPFYRHQATESFSSSDIQNHNPMSLPHGALNQRSQAIDHRAHLYVRDSVSPALERGEWHDHIDESSDESSVWSPQRIPEPPCLQPDHDLVEFGDQEYPFSPPSPSLLRSDTSRST